MLACAHDVRLDTNRERLETALEVTAKLRSRHESSLREMGGLDAPLEELEARLPHLDGTPLEAEPCVEALRALLDQLEQLKAEAAAKVEAGRIRAPSRAEALAELGAALLCEGGSPPADGSGAAAAAMAPFDQVVSEYDALQRRREALLAAVAEQHALFVVARHAEENYAERQEYLGSLSHGADEMCAIHEGLTEGHRFYKVVLTELRKASEKGAEIADLREAERASLLRRMNEPPPTFTQATAQPAAAHAAPSSYAGGGASLAEARAAWQASHAGAGGASPPPTVPAARPTATAVPARPAPVPARAVATPVPAYSSAAAAAPAPKTIMCYGCRNKFGVPPNTAIVACPFCKTHNRVPP
uniref:ALIX V-shaped domain-containing protein n=1 Tax=Emiliania huxleyi TaxID=2903 RepID=A0A7S3WKL3_EMIHU